MDAFRLLNVSFENKMENQRILREEVDMLIYQDRTTKLNLIDQKSKRLRDKKLKERGLRAWQRSRL
jgi:hypothetical protein